MHAWEWDITGLEWVWITLMMVIGPAVVVVIALLLFRGVQPSEGTSGPERPRDILAQSFARGEIDEAEYRRRRAVLRELIQAVR